MSATTLHRTCKYTKQGLPIHCTRHANTLHWVRKYTAQALLIHCTGRTNTLRRACKYFAHDQQIHCTCACKYSAQGLQTHCTALANTLHSWNVLSGATESMVRPRLNKCCPQSGRSIWKPVVYSDCNGHSSPFQLLAVLVAGLLRLQ